MSFDHDAWEKMVECLGLMVNKYTGKGQTFDNFIRGFEFITEPMSEAMYNQTIWHFIDENKKKEYPLKTSKK